MAERQAKHVYFPGPSWKNHISTFPTHCCNKRKLMKLGAEITRDKHVLPIQSKFPVSHTHTRDGWGEGRKKCSNSFLRGVQENSTTIMENRYIHGYLLLGFMYNDILYYFLIIKDAQTRVSLLKTVT